MKILIPIVGLVFGWFLAEGVKNYVKTTKTEAYLEGCIMQGGDPLKCIQKVQVYLKK